MIKPVSGKPGEDMTLSSKQPFAAAMEIVAERLGVSVEVVRARLWAQHPATVFLMFAVYVELHQRARQ